MKVTLTFNWESSLRWFVGLIVVWAALSKLANIQGFYGALLSYQLPYPDWMARWVAMSLPWLELLCGGCLLTGYRLRTALFWLFLLFCAFGIATGQAWWRGLEITCGCLNLSLIGVSSDGPIAKFLSSPGFAFLRAIILLGATAQLCRWGSRTSNSVEPAPGGLISVEQ